MDSPNQVKEEEVKKEENEVQNEENEKEEEDNVDSKQSRHSGELTNDEMLLLMTALEEQEKKDKLNRKNKKLSSTIDSKRGKKGSGQRREVVKVEKLAIKDKEIYKEKLTRTDEKKTSGTGSTDESCGYIKRMLSEFDGDHYLKQLELKKDDFGKIQQYFSEVHRVKKLLKLGESVCKVIVSDGCQGTGFVLFDGLILTNAHLFKDCVKENKLQEGTDVYVLFNYDDPEPFTNYCTFTAEKTFIDFDLELDYAILELNLEAEKPKQTAETEETKVPPGLLSKFGPPPVNGEACLIGHPAGSVKKIDPTFIIPVEKRVEAVNEHLHPYKDTLFILQSIIDVIKQKGIESIMMGGSKADKVVTYNTFMYHGASGSPVVDVSCRVFGLHTAGYCYGFLKETESVIEFAVPLLTIFEKFVGKVKKSGNNELLERVQEAANGNRYLEKIINGLNDGEEMQTNQIRSSSMKISNVYRIESFYFKHSNIESISYVYLL